jgi:predicted DNA-binding ribbon-helix-helix protein
VSLEHPFWDAMKEIASVENMTLSQLVSQINAGREYANLSSAIRLFVLNHYVVRSSTLEPLRSDATLHPRSSKPA